MVLLCCGQPAPCCPQLCGRRGVSGGTVITSLEAANARGVNGRLSPVTASRTSLPAPMSTRSDFSVWSILKRCIGLVSGRARPRSLPTRAALGPAPCRPQTARGEGSGGKARVARGGRSPGAGGQQDPAAGGTWRKQRPTGCLSLAVLGRAPRRPAPVIGIRCRGFVGFPHTRGERQAGRRTGARVPAQAHGPQALGGCCPAPRASSPRLSRGSASVLAAPPGGQQSPEEDSETQSQSVPLLCR